MSTEHPADLVNGTTTKPNIVVHTTEASPAALAIDPLISHVGDGIFLQTKTAQGLAGIFVWIALFITCQQVCFILFLFFNKQLDNPYRRNGNVIKFYKRLKRCELQNKAI